MPRSLITSFVAIVAAISRAQRMLQVQVARRLEQPPREVVAQLALHEAVVRHARGQHALAQRELRVAHQHAQLGPRQPAPGARALGHASDEGRNSSCRSSRPVGLERQHQRLVRLEQLVGDGLLLAEDLHLQVVVVQHLRADVVGESREQRVPLPAPRPSRRSTARSASTFRLTSWSEQSTPAELSIASVLMWPPAERVLDAPRLGDPEVAALGDDARAQLAAVDPDRVVGAVADVVVRLGRSPSRTCRCRRSTAGPPARAGSPGRARPASRSRPSMPSAVRASGVSAIDFAARGKTPPPGGDRGRVVVGPRAAGRARTAAAARRTSAPGRGSGRGRRGDGRRRRPAGSACERSIPLPNTSPDMSPTPTTVKRALLDVVPELAEVPAHALPRAAGGDPERLVVVARRAARGERIAEPEAVLDRRSRSPMSESAAVPLSAATTR